MCRAVDRACGAIDTVMAHIIQAGDEDGPATIRVKAMEAAIGEMFYECAVVYPEVEAAGSANEDKEDAGSEEKAPDGIKSTPNPANTDGGTSRTHVLPTPRNLEPKGDLSAEVRARVSACKAKRAGPKELKQRFKIAANKATRAALEAKDKAQRAAHTELVRAARTALRQQKELEHTFRRVWSTLLQQWAGAKCRTAPMCRWRAIIAWKNNSRARARRKAAATFRVASVKFHSILIQVDFWNGSEWIRAVAIADTGSGPTIVSERSVVEGIPRHDRAPSTVRLISADGSPLKGITGDVSSTIKFKFAGSTIEHTLPEAELSLDEDTTSIIGNGFWDASRATFCFAKRVIYTHSFTYDDEGNPDGEHREEIPFSINGQAPTDRTTVVSQQQESTTSRVGNVKVRARDDTEVPPGAIAVRARRHMQLWPNHEFKDAVHATLHIEASETHTTQVYHVYPIRIPFMNAGRTGEYIQGSTEVSSEDGTMVVAPMNVRPTLARATGRTGLSEVIVPIGISNMAQEAVEIAEGQVIGYAYPIDMAKETSQLAPTVTDKQMATLEAEALEARRIAEDSDYDSDAESREEVESHATECEGALKFVQQSRRVARLYTEAHTSFGSQTLDGIDDPTDRAWLEEIDEKGSDEVVDMILGGRRVGKWSLDEWEREMGEDLRFGPRIEPEMRTRLKCILYALQAIVSKHHLRPGMIADLEMGIELIDKDISPVKSRYRRYSPEEKRIIKAEVEKMKANGIVEYSDSPWSAPVVLVKKKDGSWRFCVNFTATVNPHIKKDAMPVPRTQDILDNLSKATLLSLWDVNSVYCQVTPTSEAGPSVHRIRHGLPRVDAVHPRAVRPYDQRQLLPTSHRDGSAERPQDAAQVSRTKSGGRRRSEDSHEPPAPRLQRG